jgi:hypothetical protein
VGSRESQGHLLILIVGGTDGLPLESSTHLKYDVNSGLALSRAAELRNWLIERHCLAGPSTVVLAASGPRSGQTDDPNDRRVEVWRLGVLPQATPASPGDGVEFPRLQPPSPKTSPPQFPEKAAHPEPGAPLDKPPTGS